MDILFIFVYPYFMNITKKLEWKEKSKTLLNKCRIFDLYMVDKESPDGRAGNFFLLDSPDWVTIIPVVTDREGRECFLMVEQYRHGSEEITFEFPAGMIDSGESPEQAAKRELLEETGYMADKMVEIGRVSPNPAFMNNISYTFLAENPELVKEQNLDRDEFINFHMIPTLEILRKMGTGKYSNGIMMMALAYYNRFRSSPS